MKVRQYSIVAIACAGSLCAQNVSMTIEVTGGSASATVNPSYAAAVVSNVSAQPGVVPPGTVFVNSASFGASSGQSSVTVLDSVPNQVAPFAFAIESSASAVASPPTGPVAEAVSTSMQATVRLTLAAVQPTRGRLQVVYSGYEYDIGAAHVAMDVGADGSVEVAASSQVFSPSLSEIALDLPLVIGAQPVPIQLQVDNTAGASAVNGQFDGHGAGLTFEVRFFPGQPVIEGFGWASATAQLHAEHRRDNVVDLRLYPTGQPGLFAFGLQSTSVAWTPTLTQLVVVDSLVVADQLLIAMPSLPPGTEWFCQGLVVSPSGELLGTSARRAFWP
jgi:hypothetical protein